MKKLALRLGGSDILQFYQEIPHFNFHFAYLNMKKNYMVNCIETLFTSRKPLIKMFAQKQTYVIHPVSFLCGQPDSNTTSTHLKNEIDQFIADNYPKQKFLNLVFSLLLRNQAINDQLYFVDAPHIHIADFVSFINNKFDKNPRSDIKSLCKKLQEKNIRIPTVCLKNPHAKKFLS